MKLGVAFITGLVCLFLPACSPQVYFDTNPSVNILPLRTYAFLPKVDSAQVSVYNRDIIDELIHKSIAAEMNSRNFAIDTIKPGLLIKFHMVVEKKEDIITSSSYSLTPYTFHKIEYKQGTLIIDFFDHASGTLAWHGWATRNIDNLTKFEQGLPDLIDEILSNYPVHRKDN